MSALMSAAQNLFLEVFGTLICKPPFLGPFLMKPHVRV